MSEATAASSTLTAREALSQAAGRMQKLIEAAQRKLEHAHSLARLAQDHEDGIVGAAEAAGMAERLIEHVWTILENEDTEPDEDPALETALDAVRRPWYYIERAFEIDGDAGPGDPSINVEMWGDYDAIPIGELARLVKAITAAEHAPAQAAR